MKKSEQSHQGSEIFPYLADIWSDPSVCEQNVRGDHSFLQLNQFILHHGVLRKVLYQNKRNLDCLPVPYLLPPVPDLIISSS